MEEGYTEHYLDNMFTDHTISPDEEEACWKIRSKCKSFARMVNLMCHSCRELDEAIKSIDQACMWANAAIARHGRRL